MMEIVREVPRPRAVAEKRRRVAVVDGSVLQRSRIGQLISQDPCLDIVHMGASVPLLMKTLRASDQRRWPHLLVLSMSPLDDVAVYARAVPALRRAGVRVLALTNTASRHLARELMIDGVEGLASCADSEAEFGEALRTVVSGGTIMTPGAQADIERSTHGPRLSVQEERVLALYASGLTITEVAARIGVQNETARKYLTRVRNKFTAAGWTARSKLDLARIAWVEGYAMVTASDIAAAERLQGVE